MTSKFVYLFELDSVRKTDKEIEIGQRALYDEIVGNGNVVVLTYNQLVDSRGFFSLLDIPEYYNNLIKLFENGAIRISQYGEIRTIAQYLINSFDYEKKFIYSGWPLKSTQKRLLALIKRSLIYSDLSEINDYINGVRSEEDIRDLFIEINPEIEQTPHDTSLSMDQCGKILNQLYWLLKIVLQLSAMHDIYVAPREESEYNHLRFHDILKVVLGFVRKTDDELWNDAVDVIKNLGCLGNDNRSVYIHEIAQAYRRCDARVKKSFQYAEAIINTVYNYACEISICNISKHYNIDELSGGDGETLSFESDFFSRLKQYWDLGDLDNRFLAGETSTFDKIVWSASFPNFTEAVRMTEYTDKSEGADADTVDRYEYKIQEQRNDHKKYVVKSIGKKVLFSVVCILVVCVIEFAFQFIQNAFDDYVNLNTPVWNIVETLVFLFVSEGVTTLLSKIIPGLLSLSEALGGIGQLMKDAFHILFCTGRTYMNLCKAGVNSKERLSKGRTIDYIKSESIRRYVDIKKDESYAPLFRDSNIYPLADMTNSGTLRDISRLEELHNYHFGIVYKSHFNMMCVDPISDKNGGYFPYERIIPIAGNGVVMVTMHKENFVLLKQYRHAPRRIQMSFPRGYGEKRIFSKDNAEKELREELNAKISGPPLLLGQISPDSGLTSGCTDVYLVEVDSYSLSNDNEGIIDIMEFSETEFCDMIHMNDGNDDYAFDDGFTLAAYELYKNYRKVLSIH